MENIILNQRKKMTDIDKKLIIEILKALKGVQRKLQELLKKQPNPQLTHETKGYFREIGVPFFISNPKKEEIFMIDEGQVTQTGDQVVTDQQSQSQSLGWRAALPDEYKEHEFVKDTQKPGDFVKRAIEVKTERDLLKTKLENAIPKLSDKATEQEKASYRKAIGVPEKPEGYEFPKIGDVENSPEMVAWAQKTFHSLGLSKDQAAAMHKEWNSFIAGMVDAEEKMAEEERTENEKKFRAEFKTEDEYKAGYELTKRFWNKVMGTNFDEAYKEAEAWQIPVFMRALFIIAKKTGEDWSPASPGGGMEARPGMIYDKTPQMKGG